MIDATASDDLPPDDADEAFAAEYVLRLLDPAETAEAAVREATDPAFAAAVARWRSDFATMDASFAAVAPSPQVKAQLETRLFGAKPSAFARLWNSASLWRWVAALAAAATIWLAVPLVAPQEPGAPRLVSALAPTEGTTAFLAVYDPADNTLRVNRTAGEAVSGRALELWVIAGDAAPVSLGVLPEDPRARVQVPEAVAALFAAGAVLAVTDEPAGGSPSGAPTGPLVSAGPLRDV